MSETVNRCLSGRWCVGRTVDGAAATVRADTLCPGCVADIQRRLDELPHYCTALRAFKGGVGGSSGEARVAGSAEPGSPLRVDVVDLIARIVWVLDQVAGYLVRDLVTLPGGVALTGWIRGVHSRADSIVGFGRVWERRHAPCPGCGLGTLGNWLGEDRIQCTSVECGVVLSKSEYEGYCSGV